MSRTNSHDFQEGHIIHPPPAYTPKINIPIPTLREKSINIYDMYVSLEEISNRIYTRCKTKNIFLKKLGYNLFSLEIKYKYNDTTDFIIYFSLKDNKIYFQIYKYDLLLYYIFLKITSVLNSDSYVYVYDNSKNYMTLFTILNIILKNNKTPINSILREENKSYFEYLIEKNMILKKVIDDGNNIHLTTINPSIPSNSITLNSTNRYIIDNADDLHLLQIYNKSIIETYLKTNKSVDIFFNTRNMDLDDLIKTSITEMKCDSKRKKIKLSKTQKHKPLSFEKKSKRVTSLNSITRKYRESNLTSRERVRTSREREHIPVFNNENINVGLLIITLHGGIQIEETEDKNLLVPIRDIPVGNTKLYYKSITLPGYYNFFIPEQEVVRRSDNSEDNNYDYVGDSLLSDIKSESVPTITNNNFHNITLGHYRNIFEKCFKKTPLTFDKIFYSCGNKIINKYLRGIKSRQPNLRKQDNKEIDYSKLNKTTGPGPITKILDKVLDLGSDMKQNTKITFIVFNNSSKKFEKYNLSNFSLPNLFILGRIFKSLTNISQLKSGRIHLSSLIELVLSYRKGLSSLYVYDTSCSWYNSEVASRRLNEIDVLIDSLPADVGK